MFDLVLLRHGQSTWNALNLFTGWEDVDLTEKGEEEAKIAGELLRDEPDLDLEVVHTSLLTRAIRTSDIALHAAGRSWLPVKRNWRLNERHYGDLQGKNKAETKKAFGDEQLMLWRRSFATPPPPLQLDDSRSVSSDPRYRDIPAKTLPQTECLKDVVERFLPYWFDVIIPDLRNGAQRNAAVLVVAHGNSLRALRMHLDGLSEDEVVDLEIPTGFPYRYRLEADFGVLEGKYLGDPTKAARAAEEVARQADGN